MEIAKRILARVSGQSMPLAGARFSVSIGIAVSAHADFSEMFRDADAALYQGREDGKSRIGIFTPSNDDVILTEIEISKESLRHAVPLS